MRQIGVFILLMLSLVIVGCSTEGISPSSTNAYEYSPHQH